MSFSSPTFQTDNPTSTLSLQSPHLATLAGRAYRCKCGVPVFFRNSECLACGTPLGYDPEQARLLPLMPGKVVDTWVVWQADQPGDLKIRIQQIKLGDSSNKEVLRSINTGGLKISEDR